MWQRRTGVVSIEAIDGHDAKFRASFAFTSLLLHLLTFLGAFLKISY